MNTTTTSGSTQGLPGPFAGLSMNCRACHLVDEFRFGLDELAGLNMFLAEPTSMPPSVQELSRGGIGNCIACHAAPAFTDFKLHNTGTAQTEYDAIHGKGQFARLMIPDLAERTSKPELYLPRASRPHCAGVVPQVAQ